MQIQAAASLNPFAATLARRAAHAAQQEKQAAKKASKKARRPVVAFVDAKGLDLNA